MSDLRYNELSKEIKKISKRCCCASGSIEAGCCYEEVTYAEAAAKIAANTLVKGKMYKITDRGDLGIFLEAISKNQFNQEGSRLMLIPNWNCYTAFRMYNENLTYNEGDQVIWDGKVWNNITGNNTHLPGEDTIDWEVIPKAIGVQSTSCEEGVYVYVENWFGIIYDFDNDWISKQWDDRRNVFGMSYDLVPKYSANPVDLSDWWIAQFFNFGINNTIYMYNNECEGIWNNYPSEGADAYVIVDNRIPGAIYENKVVSNHIALTGISSNTNSGKITENLVSGKIHLNSNLGDIASNGTNVLGIYKNKNIGGIENNTNEGEISNNSNSGNIYGNFNLGGILYNKNNGDISDNSNNFDDTPDSGLIAYNVNNGMIYGNLHLGNVVNNANNGDITDCDSGVSQCNIYDNVNNGDISNTFVADVFDTAVNK